MGTAHTGQIITAAALILIVVTGAFGFSEIVMMKYIAYGMIAALIIDATVIRMLLVPSVMTLLGDDCWWAPRWMKRVQQRIGLGEIRLPDERPTGNGAGAAAGAPAGAVPSVGAAVAGAPVAATSVIPRITTDQTPAFAAEPEEDRRDPRPAPPRREQASAHQPRQDAPGGPSQRATGQHSTEPRSADPGSAGPGRAGPGRAGPGGATSRTADPYQRPENEAGTAPSPRTAAPRPGGQRP